MTDGGALEQIGADRLIGGKTQIKMRTPYSGCSLAGVSYTLTEDTRTIVSQDYEPGTHTVEFSEPYANLSASGAFLSEAHTNYAVIEVATVGTVSLYGVPYSKTTKTFTKNTEDVNSANKANLKEFGENTMIHPDYAQARLDALFDYYMKKYQADFQVLGNNVCGDYVSVCGVEGNIEKQQIQLLSGCITDGTVI